MDPGDPRQDELLERAGHGDKTARQGLLALHRNRLKQMIAVRMDRRIAARIDPSDVVQEALADAWQKLSDYLRERPLPFYPWLRQLAWKRLVDLHREHLAAQKRSVTRERRLELGLPERSAAQLAGRLIARGTSPSGKLLREELRARVKAALDAMNERDREVLVLRYLEQLSTGEIAAVLGIQEGTVRMRQLRALERLRQILGEEAEDFEP